MRTTLLVQYSDSTKRELQQQWYAWFITDSTQSLIIADDEGTNQRYVVAMPFSIVHEEDGDGLVKMCIRDRSYTSGLIEDMVGRTKRNFQLIFSDTGATTWAFTALVTGFKPSAGVEDELLAEVTLQVTGQPTLAG